MQQLTSRFGLAFALLVLGAVDVAYAEPCRNESFEDTAYTVCSFDPARDDIRMFLRNEAGTPYNTFEALAEALKEEGQHLAFAINGGMYGDDFSPTGLFVEEGRELSPINTKTVTGEPQDIPNFYKKPNGV